MTTTDRSSVRTTVYWTSGSNLLAGIWLVIAPFALAYNDIEGALWNDIIIGISIFVLVLAAWSAYASRDVRPGA